MGCLRVKIRPPQELQRVRLATSLSRMPKAKYGPMKSGLTATHSSSIGTLPRSAKDRSTAIFALGVIHILPGRAACFVHSRSQQQLHRSQTFG
jgi:hypothetical protein